MKRIGNLWSEITDYNNLLLAHHNARKGKKHYAEVKMVNNNEEFYIKRLRNMLLDKTFTTSKYKVFEKFDGRKNRILHKLPYYPDRIVQHAIIQILGPIWIYSMIRDTFQSIPNRGTSDARKRVRKTIRNNEDLYFIKFDIKKYYPSVDNKILKTIIRRKIKCKDTLQLLDDIIDSSNGIPIGNYTSQYFGNIYLNYFDWFVKQNIKHVGYFRYCDDIIIICENSIDCHEARKKCFVYLQDSLNLDVKSNWCVRPIKDGMDFVGYVFFSNRVFLRRSIKEKFNKKTKTFKKNHKNKIESNPINSAASYWGYIKHSNSKRLWKTNIDKEYVVKSDKFCKKKNPLREILQ